MSAEKSKLFCLYYLHYGNIYEAAVKAGFNKDTALSDGIAVLSSPKFKRFISSLSSESYVPPSVLVRTGLERLAFGSSNDAVYLVFSDELPPPDKIAELDLFNVSEIKRVKGGGVEVKLFDRLKALEKIFEISGSVSNENSALSLINALRGDSFET